ncbi:MAG: helix-turn-helix transcriptional regulator [Bacteroidales bacterium]
MNESEKNYFKKLSGELLKENDSFDAKHFHYPLMPLQYSYVHNLKTGQFENVQGVDKILGYTNESFTLELYYQKLHQIDRKMIFETSKDNLNLANERISQVTNEGAFESQFTILYRIKSKEGKYVHILRQSTILEYHKKIHKTFSLCTDVSALGLTYKVNSVFWFKDISKVYSVDQIESKLNKKWSNLTTREFEILVLIAQGKTTKEIGRKLNISIYTVNKHRQNIISKTSTGNIKELIDKTFHGSL